MTTSFLHKDRNLLHLSLSKENQNTNSKKSSTHVYTTTSSNTELSGQDTHQNTIKPGTRPTTSKMQTSQSGTSTPATPTSHTSSKLEEQGNGDILVSVSQAPNQKEAPPLTTENTHPSGELGDNDRLAGDDADKPAIPLTLGLGKSRTKAEGTRCTPMDGVLQ